MLKESVPMVKKIWSFPPTDGRREAALEADLRARESFERAIRAKQMDLDSVVVDPNPGTYV
jgi:hypothetical protein